jgi:hypothetical protein
MDWLVQNWFWLVVLVLFFAVHLFGHGGHVGHGGDTDATRRPADKDKDKVEQDNKDRPQGHHH